MNMDKGKAYSTVNPVNHGRPKRMQGRISEILIAFAAMTLPMLTFSGILLGLIFHYRITQNNFASDTLAFETDQIRPDAYYVRISATALITVASWFSTIAPILTGFAVTLVSYPVAKHLLAASETYGTPQLPTPFQLSLIIRTISIGSFSALWGWLTYAIDWRGRRESQVKSVKTLTTILTLGITLSLLVLATDTWLHFTTKTVIFSQVHAGSDDSGLGFGLYQNCTNTTKTLLSFNLNNPASGAVLLNPDPMRVLSNLSDTQVVPIHEVGQDQFAYLASPQKAELSDLDYSVSTYAVQSKCTPVTSQCANASDTAGVGLRYKCPFKFEGFASTAVGATNSVAMAYFTDSTGSNNNTNLNPIGNPYYYSTMIVANMRNGRPTGIDQDPQIIQGTHGGSTIIALFCSATVYDVTYSSVNGTIKTWDMSTSNLSTTQILQGTQRLTEVGLPNLVQAASIAGLSNSSQSIADQFALAYSQTAVAVASAAFEPRAALVSQVREQILVARVSKAPLFALIAANLILVLLGIILTIVALVAVRGDTGEVQGRLNIQTLVATMFEGRVRLPAEQVEDMFHERHNEQGPRIGFIRTAEGGWMFQSWTPT